MSDDKSLTLNDFCGFDRTIFSDTDLSNSERGRWEALAYRLYDTENDELLFPIDHAPNTIEEHQFCHYVLWMVIWAMRHKTKPWNLFCKSEDHVRTAIFPLCNCFACSWKCKTKERICPIKTWRPCICCVESTEGDASQFARWAKTGNEEYAYNIAHLEWEEWKR